MKRSSTRPVWSSRSRVRIRRLDEALTILDGLMRGQTVDFEGEFYTINGLQAPAPAPVGPRPPIAVGGGPRMLALAALSTPTSSRWPQAPLPRASCGCRT